MSTKKNESKQEETTPVAVLDPTDTEQEAAFVAAGLAGVDADAEAPSQPDAYLPESLVQGSVPPKVGLLSALGFPEKSIEVLTAPKAAAKANRVGQGGVAGRGKLQQDGSRPKGTFIDILKKKALDDAKAKGHEFGLYKNERVFFHAVNTCKHCGATLDIQPGVDGADGDSVTGTALATECSEEARKAFESSKPATVKPEKAPKEPKAGKAPKAAKDERQLSPIARKANQMERERKTGKPDPTLANSAPAVAPAPVAKKKALSEMTDEELIEKFNDLSEIAGSDTGAAKMAQTQLSGLREFCEKKGLSLDTELPITSDMLENGDSEPEDLDESETVPSEACNGMRAGDTVGYNGQAATVIRIHESGEKVVLKLKGLVGEYEVPCNNPNLRVRKSQVSA